MNPLSVCLIPNMRRPSAIVAATAMALSAHAADRTWNNGAATGNWNTTDANWTGSTWSNTTPDNAIFNADTGTISLTEAITAGNFTFGLTNANSTGTFTGSTLAITGNLVAQADGNNYPAINPTLSFSNDVSVGGDVVISRRNIEVTGGTFAANRLVSQDSWGRLLVSGGTVTFNNGIDDSILTGGNTLSVLLQGGSLHTPYIKTTSASWTGVGEDGVVLNGGTLHATAGSGDFIQTYAFSNWGNRNNVGVGTAGANIDTHGFDITITKSLQNYGGAGVLTKTGSGTLTLTAANSYSGGTTVDQGTLLLDGANAGYARIIGALTVNNGAAVNFANDDGTGLGWIDGSKVTSLTINGGTVSSAGTIHVWNFSGGVHMTGGTLQSNGGTSDPNGPQMEWINADVTTHASADTATIGGRIRMRADGGVSGIVFDVADGAAATDLLMSAAVTQASGDMRITKRGAGKMVLTGSNTHGNTVIENGILEVNTVIDGTSNLGGGWLAMDNTSTLRYTGTGSETTGRDLWINNNAGTRTIDVVDPAAVLTLIGGGQIIRDILKAGDGTLVLGKVVSGSASITANGGTLVLAATNTHTGGVTIHDGVLKAGANQAFGDASSTATVNGGWLDLNGYSQTLAALNGGTSGGVRGGTGAVSILTIGNGNASSSFGGAIEGNLALVKAGTGTLTLSGPVAPDGIITVEAGTLDLSAATLSPNVRINVSKDAFVKLPTTAVGKVYLDNVKLAPGTWGAPGSVAAGLADHESPSLAGPGIVTVPDTGLSSRERWKTMKHGFFVHYVWDGSGGVTHNVDGSSPTSVNDVADRFDAAGFANDLESMAVEYVIFTAWHSLFYPLFDSAAMEKYFPGRTPSRDMVGDMIDAVRAKGIRVLLYTHPMQPISWDYNTHNNLINDVHAEVVERYGDRIDGLFLDENDVNGNQDSFVDYPRLVRTIRLRNPELVLIQNYTGNIYSCDMLHYETGNPRNDLKPNPDATWTTPTPTTQLLTQNWSALQPKVPTATPAIWRSAEGIFRTAVVGAGSSVAGGGWLWAAGPYPGDGTWLNPSTGQTQFVGRWEQGVLEAMQGAAAYIAPVAESIKNTYPSTSWLTKPYTHITALPYGIVATRSTDNTKEYIHVLNPPGTKTLTLPAPADGKVFTNARLLKNSRAVTLTRTSRGMSLRLGASDNWETLNTVIVMDVVSPGGRGLTNNNGSSVAYTGSSWIYQNNRGVGEFQDDIHFATTDGDFATFTFDGTDVEFLSTAGPNRGPVDVYLDDVFQQTIDLYDADTFQLTAFSKSGLPRGRHTLKLVKQGGQYLTVDAFKVTDLINSDDPSIAYAGSWSNKAVAGAIGGEVRETANNGDSLTLHFEGAGIDLLSPRGIGGATVNVHFNDFYATGVTQSFTFEQNQAVTLSNTHVLNFGTNKLTLTKNRGTWMGVDAFRVYKAWKTPALRWGASGGGGTGTWNVNNSANWFDGTSATKWEDFGGSDYAAVFGGTAGTVSLATGVRANHLAFQTTGYILQNNSLTLDGTSPVITTSSGVTATINSTVAGGAGLVKEGAGTLNLTSSNPYTGNTTVSAGTLSLGNGTANSNLADSSSVIIATGATLHLNFTGTDTVNALIVSGIARPPGIYSSANSSFITGSGTLTVLTGPATDYDGWASFHALTGGQNDDDDHDGLTNRAEYAFGLNPKLSSANPVTILPQPSGFQITYTRRKTSLSGLTFSVWTSSDLTEWSEDTGAIEFIDTTDGDVETVEVTPSAGLFEGPRLFLRIQAN